MGDCALHTVIGRNSRRRNGLEPSRRLSKTPAALSPSAFRVAVPAKEVTKRGARWGSSGGDMEIDGAPSRHPQRGDAGEDASPFAASPAARATQPAPHPLEPIHAASTVT